MNLLHVVHKQIILCFAQMFIFLTKKNALFRCHFELAQTQREKKNYMYQQKGENYAQTRGEKTINKLNVRKL